MTIVDAHHHLWNPEVVRYELLSGAGRLAPLVRPVLAAEFDGVARANGIASAVLVEAASAGADPAAETAFLLAQMATSTISTRMVAYAPIESLLIDRWLKKIDPRVVGIRRTFEGVPNGFMTSDTVIRGIQCVGEHGLPFDLVLFSNRLEEAVALVRRLPSVTFVLDHLGKPPLTAPVPDRWRVSIAALAALPNVVAKVSGLVTETHGDWRADLGPYLEHAIGCFGWNRLMFASDWPICELASSYSQWLSYLKSLVGAAGSEEQEAFFSGTATRTYGLAPSGDRRV